MPFREKNAWISAISMMAIYGVYFWSVVRNGPHVGNSYFAGLAETVLALIIVQVVLNIAVAIRSPREAQAPRDEREKLIELRSTRAAYAGLATAVAMACFFGALNPPIVFNANSLLLILVTAELVRSGSQIIQYRRGA